jgi:DNA-binding protein Fis
MIINLNLTTTASRENTKIIRDLCKEICDYYYIEYNGEAVFELTTDSSSVLVDWAKDRYKLNINDIY